MTLQSCNVQTQRGPRWSPWDEFLPCRLQGRLSISEGMINRKNEERSLWSLAFEGERERDWQTINTAIRPGRSSNTPNRPTNGNRPTSKPGLIPCIERRAAGRTPTKCQLQSNVNDSLRSFADRAFTKTHSPPALEKMYPLALVFFFLY